jgi:hypothetical protein
MLLCLSWMHCKFGRRSAAESMLDDCGIMAPEHANKRGTFASSSSGITWWGNQLLATEFWSNYYKHDTQRSFDNFTDKKKRKDHITF